MVNGHFRSAKSPRAASRSSSSWPRRTTCESGASSRACDQVSPSGSACRRSRHRWSASTRLGSNWRPLPAAGHRERGGRAVPPDVHLDGLAQLHDPGRERHLLAAESLGKAAPVPALERAPDRVRDPRVEPHLRGHQPGGQAVRVDQGGHPGPRHRHHREHQLGPSGRGTADAEVLEHVEHVRQSRPVQLVAAGSERQVVAEPAAELVRVRVTTDPEDQVGVVHRRPVVVVEPELLGQHLGDQRAAQHVLHRESQAEVDRDRQRREHLRAAHTGLGWSCCHASRMDPQSSPGKFPIRVPNDASRRAERSSAPMAHRRSVPAVLATSSP